MAGELPTRLPIDAPVRSWSRSSRDSTLNARRVGGTLEGGGELFEGKGLGEIVARAGAHGLDCRVDGGEGGHDDDDGLGMMGVDIFEERKATTAGKLEIEQKDIDGGVLEGEARGGDRVCGLGGEAEAGGDFGAGVANGGVVVHDQYAQCRETVSVGAASYGEGRVVLGPGDVGGCGDGVWGRAGCRGTMVSGEYSLVVSTCDPLRCLGGWGLGDVRRAGLGE